jgi:hypothetical protein
MIGVVLSSWERERVLSGTHAASGRHVSTWAHAVIAGKASSLGVPSHSCCSPSLRLDQSSFLTTLMILWKSVTLPDSPGIHALNHSPSSSPLYLARTFGIL